MVWFEYNFLKHVHAGEPKSSSGLIVLINFSAHSHKNINNIKLNLIVNIFFFKGGIAVWIQSGTNTPSNAPSSKMMPIPNTVYSTDPKRANSFKESCV